MFTLLIHIQSPNTAGRTTVRPDYYYSSSYVIIDFDAPETYEVKYHTSLNEEVETLYGNGKSYLPYPSEETTYYFYMVNENQEIVSETIEYTLSTIETVSSNYNYYNPSEITVTYNDNGSFNAYVETQFECDDPDVYYEFILTDDGHSNVSAVTQGKYAVIEDFMDYGGRGVTFNIFKMVNGIKHCFNTVTPSGTLECNGDISNYVDAYIDTSSDNPILNFTNYFNFKFDTSTFYIILDNGDRINVDESLFIKDEYDCYSLTYELPSGVNSCELHMEGSNLYNNYDKYKEDQD